MKEPDIRALIKIGTLLTETDYERALSADRTLRLLIKEEPALINLRNELRSLIVKYESLNWSDIENISAEQLTESLAAENLIAAEQQFISRRKEIILSRLIALGLIQKDLGTLLNHNKSYTSELLNGIRSFSLNDLILIHKLLKIDLKELFPTLVPIEIQERVKASVSKISSKKVRLKTSELELVSL